MVRAMQALAHKVETLLVEDHRARTCTVRSGGDGHGRLGDGHGLVGGGLGGAASQPRMKISASRSGGRDC